MAPKNPQTPSRLSMESLGRTISDISFELTKDSQDFNLHPISEVEDAKCECCGMSEECTQEYINKVRKKYSGKLICGLCSEAVKGEMEKGGGKELEEALEEHMMNSCAKFNRLGRAYPVLCQAEAMREILKKREKSLSPKDKGSPNNHNKGGIARSSSCMASISKVINNHGVVN